MSQPKPTSVIGCQLLALLPEVYRTRDNGDLASYLDACGELLDQVRNTLDQLLADAFPDQPLPSRAAQEWIFPYLTQLLDVRGELLGQVRETLAQLLADAFPTRLPTGRAAQEWILPYLAQLLDVRLISPYVDGRRHEIARAIAWRQRKGTVRAVEEIAEVVGQLEVEVQEGWRRIAITPRINIPILSAAAIGEPAPDDLDPLEAARHPGLPAVTPDLAWPSRAVQSSLADPGARLSSFGGQELCWRQANRHGVPCFPGSFDDASRRMPDLRTPDWRQGHAHPRRALLFVPPPLGFFPPNQVKLSWSQCQDHILDMVNKDGVRLLSISAKELGDTASPKAVTITDDVVLSDRNVVIAGLNFDATVTIDGGRAELYGVAARKLLIKTAGIDQPVLVAVDCLFEEIEAAGSLVRSEYTTITGTVTCRQLQATDSIFAGSVKLTGGIRYRRASCVRYSRIPSAFAVLMPAARRPESTTDQPVFFNFEICDQNGIVHRSVDFGEPGYAVLHPASPSSICLGSEDGGEMGAYHHRRYCLQAAAVLDKLKDYLPVGIEAVLVPDPRLLRAPPRATR